jgi:tight adherence protein C
MQNGLSFAETLREFGERSHVKEMRKFANLMLSDRKRGDAKLLEYLREMNEEAWEQKKKIVKEKTEEADTRLVLPLMMMLIVILVVVLAPAIMTIRG